MKRLLLALGLLFSTTVIFSTTPGTLDTDSFNSSASYPPLIAGIVTTDIGSGSQDNAYASAIQPDGKLVVAGSTYDGGSTTIFAVTRYNIDGSLDGTFGSDGIVTTNISNSMVLESDIARGVAIQNDGKIVVVGSTGSPTKFVVARYLTNGSLDTATFNSGASGGDIAGVRTITFGTTSVANAVAIQSNGYIVIAGSTTSSTTSVALARLDASGNLDTGGFGTGGKQTLAIGTMLSPTVDVANALAIDSNQFIVIAGSSGTSLLVARFDTTGALDASGFNTTGYNVQAVGASTLAVGYAVGFQSTGKIIVTGKSDLNAVVVRFTTSGLLDSGASAFGTGGTPIGYNAANKFGYTSAVAYGLVIQSDDKIVIGGTALRASLLLNDFFLHYKPIHKIQYNFHLFFHPMKNMVRPNH